MVEGRELSAHRVLDGREIKIYCVGNCVALLLRVSAVRLGPVGVVQLRAAQLLRFHHRQYPYCRKGFKLDGGSCGSHVTTVTS